MRLLRLDDEAKKVGIQFLVLLHFGEKVKERTKTVETNKSIIKN